MSITPDEIKIIAVDFDNTIVTGKFPEVGEEIELAIETMKDLQKRGKKLMLFTCRAGHYLKHAVMFLRSKGITLDAVNDNIPGHPFSSFKESSIKPYYDMLIDDRNFPCHKTVDWKPIREFFKLDTKEEEKSE